ncbi:GAP1-N2 domain-containing protein [Rhodococcus sp. NPDC054953]
MMNPDRADLPRFGQLTYTSFDPASGAQPGVGGWQVKDVAGAVDAAEADLMRSGISTRFETVGAAPEFPTRADLDGRPRRLMYVPDVDGRGCYWHTAPAGPDAAGRPGNVFAHVVLDRGARSGEAASRPVELWRSPGWLVPYGSVEVDSASLAGVPEPAGTMDRSSTLDFLLDEGTWRVGVLCVLLDAVARAMTGGPAVVLGTHTPDDAARWIAAVSHFMSPGAARRFGWCTFDRRHDLDETVARGVHLTALPISDLDGVPSRHTVVASSETPQLGEFGGDPHRTERGDAVPVTAWSVLAQTALVDERAADHALSRQDSVARELGDVVLSPMWPLATAILEDQTLHDAAGEAARVVLEQTPDTIDDESEIAHIVAAVVDDHLGDSAESAADVLAHGADEWSAGARRLAGRVLLFRALDDEDWRLSGPGRSMRVDSDWVSQDVLSRAARVIAELCERWMPRGAIVDGAAETLITLDFMARADLVDAGAAALLSALLADVVVPVLCDPAAGAELVAAAGPIGERAWRDHVLPALTVHPLITGRPLGNRLPRPVLAAAFAAIGDDTLAELVADQCRVADPSAMLLAEGAFQTVTAGALAEAAYVAPLALRRALFEAAGSGWAPTDIDPVVFGYRWSARDFLELLDEFPDALAPRHVEEAIVGAAWSADVEELTARIHVAAGRRAVTDRDLLAVSWAIVRGWSWDAVGTQDLWVLLRDHAMPVLDSWAAERTSGLPQDLLVRLAVLMVAGHAYRLPGLSSLPAAHEDALVRAVRGDERAAVVAVATLVRAGAIDPTWAAVHAVLSSPTTPRVAPASNLLRRMEIGQPEARSSLLEAAVRTVWSQDMRRTPIDEGQLMEAVRAELVAWGVAEADYVSASARPLVRSWIDGGR